MNMNERENTECVVLADKPRSGTACSRNQGLYQYTFKSFQTLPVEEIVGDQPQPSNTKPLNSFPT